MTSKQKLAMKTIAAAATTSRFTMEGYNDRLQNRQEVHVMKKALVYALCVVGFILIAAPTAVEYHPVLLNGKALGNGIIIQGGIIAISVEDLVKAAGGALTLEPYFRLQGNRLLAEAGVHDVAKKAVTPGTQAELVPAVHPPFKEPPVTYKASQPGALDTKAGIKLTPGQFLRVQKSGEISSHVFMQDGKAFVPLADVARAFGGVFTPPSGGAASVHGGTLKPGEQIRLNFAGNPNSILIGL
jgi:hypothetical protein